MTRRVSLPVRLRSQEAMQLMVEGDKWEMYLPAGLAYGDSGRVPGCLVFTMEILKINGGSKPKVKKDD